MADYQSTAQRIGLTPGKGALIGTLALALGGVAYVQLGGSGGEYSPAVADTPRTGPSRQTTTTTPPRTPTVETTAGGEAAGASIAFDPTRWESPRLSDVIAHDPFALPAAFPQGAQALSGTHAAGGDANTAVAALAGSELADTVERLQQQLEELRQRGVHVIIRQRDEYVAMIGDRTIHVGDEINGFTVTAIEPDGVRVERKGVE